MLYINISITGSGAFREDRMCFVSGTASKFKGRTMKRVLTLLHSGLLSIFIVIKIL
jgi:hypothetical protein